MKFNPKLKYEIEKFKKYIIIVESEKDVQTLKKFGFEKVYAIHKTGTPLDKRIKDISSLFKKKEKLCILTNMNRKGRLLYQKIKTKFQELGVKIDSKLRGILIKIKISHVKDISRLIEKIEKIN